MHTTKYTSLLSSLSDREARTLLRHIIAEVESATEIISKASWCTTQVKYEMGAAAIKDSAYQVCQRLADSGRDDLALNVLRVLYRSDELLHSETCEITYAL